MSIYELLLHTLFLISEHDTYQCSWANLSFSFEIVGTSISVTMPQHANTVFVWLLLTCTASLTNKIHRFLRPKGTIRLPSLTLCLSQIKFHLVTHVLSLVICICLKHIFQKGTGTCLEDILPSVLWCIP